MSALPPKADICSALTRCFDQAPEFFRLDLRQRIFATLAAATPQNAQPCERGAEQQSSRWQRRLGDGTFRVVERGDVEAGVPNSGPFEGERVTNQSQSNQRIEVGTEKRVEHPIDNDAHRAGDLTGVEGAERIVAGVEQRPDALELDRGVELDRQFVAVDNLVVVAGRPVADPEASEVGKRLAQTALVEDEAVMFDEAV